MKRARTRVLTVVIAISLVLMLMLPLLAQSITNPLDNVGAIAQTFEGGFGGTQAGTLVAVATANATPVSIGSLSGQ